MRIQISVFLLLFLSLYGCFNINCNNRVSGKGAVITEKHSVSSFNKLIISGAFQAELQQSAQYSLDIKAYENIHPYIEINHTGNTLEIRFKKNISIRNSGSIKVYISAPEVDDIEVSGASSITARQKSNEKINIELSGASKGNFTLNSPEISMALSGASSVSAKGSTQTLEVNASGACQFNTTELLAETVNADIGGASKGKVFASVAINGEVSGASSLKYEGNPQVNTRTAGASSVNRNN